MKKKCSAVVAINLLLLDDEIDCEQLLEMLQTDVLKYNIIEDCLPAYIQALLKAGIHELELCHPDQRWVNPGLQANSERGMVEDSGWISEVIPGDNSTFYFDADNFTGHWVPPENHNHTQVFLNSSEIRSCIITCTEAFNKGWFAN